MVIAAGLGCKDLQMFTSEIALMAYPRHHSFDTRTSFASSSSLRFASSTFGNDNLRLSSVSTSTVETTSRVNHLLSAGTTYHGASLVAVLRIISSYAS